MPVFSPLPAAHVVPSAPATPDAVDETPADRSSPIDFDPRTNPGIKDSLERRALSLDIAARRWPDADGRLRRQTTALLAWARALQDDDRASADALRNLHDSIELLPKGLLEPPPPVRPVAQLFGALSRVGRAARGVREDLRLLTSSRTGAIRHSAKPPSAKDLQQRLIKVDQDLFELELKTSKLASQGCKADQPLAVNLRCGELRDLRAMFDAATRCNSNTSSRWKADALIRKVEERMADIRMWVGGKSQTPSVPASPRSHVPPRA